MFTPPLPPRLVLEVACLRASGGHWFARSSALLGIVAGGVTSDAAAENLRHLAEGIAGEPVKAVVTVINEEHAAL